MLENAGGIPETSSNPKTIGSQVNEKVTSLLTELKIRLDGKRHTDERNDPAASPQPAGRL